MRGTNAARPNSAVSATASTFEISGVSEPLLAIWEAVNILEEVRICTAAADSCVRKNGGIR